MKKPSPKSAITRRQFTRALALPAGVLLLGGALPAWAEKTKDKQAKPSVPAKADRSQPKYECKLLWDSGDIEDAGQNKKSIVRAYKGHAYKIFILPGMETMIAKIPLDGGKVQTAPLMPGHLTSVDPHCFCAIGLDSEGYIHVSGDVHSSAHPKHWISTKPEDISEFVFTSKLGENKRPQGQRVTYPHFFQSPDGELYHLIRCAEPVWGIGISVLDVKTQTWTMLGADVPPELVSVWNPGGKRAKEARSAPMTVWEDNGEWGDLKYTQPHGNIVWGKNKRMHCVFGLLNKSLPAPKDGGKHTGTHVLYAYSDDGGKTFFRGNGTKIQLPMRADAGPYQADVVFAKTDGPPPWVSLLPSISIDEQDRPVVRCREEKPKKTFIHHSFVLDQGQWVELGKNADRAAAKPGGDDDDDDDDAGDVNVRNLDLPHKVMFYDKEYLRDTGSIVYQVEVPDNVVKTHQNRARHTGESQTLKAKR